MTGKTPYIALLLAIVLGIGAWLVSRTPADATASTAHPTSPTITSGQLAFAVDPATIVRIERMTPNGEVQAIRRQSDGRWLYEMPGGGDWPTDSQAILSLLRTVAQTPAVGEVDPDTSVGADAVTVRFLRADDSSVDLRLARTPVGGNRVIEVTGDDNIARTALVNARFAAPLVDPGLTTWRLQRAIPGMGRAVSRVTLTQGETTLQLARIQGRWRVRTPIDAPAEQSAVDELLDALAKIDIVEFRDGQDTDAALSTHALSITVERDIRVFDDPANPDAARIATRARALHIGATLDPAAATCYARAGGADGTQHNLLVNIASLNLATLLEPMQYISRTPMLTAPQVIQTIEIERGSEDPIRWSRGVNGWELRDPNNTLIRILTDEQGAQIDQTLALLAAPASPSIASNQEMQSISIRLLDREAQLLERLDIIPGADDTARVRSGPVIYDLSRPLPPILLDQLPAR